MHTDYDDIRSRIGEPPQWFDENAVPRYCTFHPSRLASIYAKEGVLAEITCQGCGEGFLVAFSELNIWQLLIASKDRPERTLAELIRSKELHYGDPPNIGCCRGGESMNSEPRRVIEYWRREVPRTWQRDSSLEIDIQPPWVLTLDRQRGLAP
ncbi:MAG TPA: hypothetical protein VFB68_02515 [Xanthobacteraceae bacterium]|nr:hypothetical protein [Xanthobacteraceae bacterium]